MKKQLLEKIRFVTPYVPGEQPDIKNIIKLNTNENPYPPSPKVQEILNNFNSENLRLYPSFECKELKEVLSDKYNISKNEIFIGNGSDEVLALCFLTFFNSDKSVLFPDITYSFYDVWCDLYNIKFERIPLDNSFKINKIDYYKKNGGIIIANPNAPTGIYMDLDDIEDILSNNQDSIVIIDEAYIDFGGNSSVKLINKYENLVVVHTFSKSRSLAGIRIGYAMANSELIEALEAIKNSFNSYTINSLSQIIAAECAKDENYYNNCIKKIIETRQWVTENLESIGFNVLPSLSNFIFISNDNINAEELFNCLKSKNIIVRYFNKPRINNYLRVTIGKKEDMEKFFEEVKKFIKSKNNN